MAPRLLPLLVLLLGACSPTGDDAANSAAQPAGGAYFDLRGYMTAQIDSLTAARPAATKTVLLNGRTEQQPDAEVDFAADLATFREADINKPAWTDQYTAEESNGLLRYVAQDSTLRTQELRVRLDNDGRPEQIDLRLRTGGGLLSHGSQTMTYRPAAGYRIALEQDNRFGSDVAATITVDWAGN